MKYLATLLLIFGFGLSGFGQTIKSLGYNTTNGQVVANTEVGIGLRFTNNTVDFKRVQVGGTSVTTNGFNGNVFIGGGGSISFISGGDPAVTRTNFGLGATWLTNTNVSNFRTAIGLGITNRPEFATVDVTFLYANAIMSDYGNWFEDEGGGEIIVGQPLAFGTNAGQTRTNLGLGRSWLTNTNSPIFPDSSGRLVAPVIIYDLPNDRELLTIPTDSGQAVDPIVMNAESGAWNTSNNRTALGLGILDVPSFAGVKLISGNNTTNQIYAASELNISRDNVNFMSFAGSPNRVVLSVPLHIGASSSSIEATTTRTNLGLGATNVPTFRRLIVDPNASGALGVQYGNNDSGLYNGGTYNILSLRVGGINALTAETNGVTFASPAAVRTNLGLGGGVTATNTFVSYNGTNYTTNIVTISNGIITGWTQ